MGKAEKVHFSVYCCSLRYVNSVNINHFVFKRSRSVTLAKGRLVGIFKSACTFPLKQLGLVALLTIISALLPYVYKR